MNVVWTYVTCKSESQSSSTVITTKKAAKFTVTGRL